MSSNPHIPEAVNTYIDDKVPGGMLSSPHIKYCIKKYKIIEDHDWGGLRAASYDMRIGGSVLTWVDGEKKEIKLGKETDVNKNIYTSIDLRPNSLTFVTTIEKFNLPKDIIARFNLKSKLVHEGLLLGTGPIVDPELKANLFIPLHNFSNRDITLNYGDEFICVEFTKTLNPDDEIEFEDENTKEKEVCKYVKNRNRIFDFGGYKKRLEGKKVESSVLSALNEHGKSVEEYRDKLQFFSWVGAATFGAIFIGLLTLVFTTWMLLSSSQKTSTEAANVVKEYKDQNIDFRVFALNSDAKNNEKQITELRESLKALEKNYSLTSLPSLKFELNKINARISKLEESLKTPSVEGTQKGL
jgi:deoxycytidine triphosphate deaminase